MMHRHAPLALAALLAGCSSAPAPRETSAERVLRPGTAQPSPRTVRVSPPAALDARPVTWDDLHDAMVEAAGAVALEETVLDRLLAREAARLGIRVEEADLEQEERALLDSLSSAAGGASGPAVLQRLRRERGLGPKRYRALLRRTATMRAIVAPSVNVAPEALELAREIRFGEQHRVRLITAPSLIEAQTALRALERGDPFAEVAVRLSTDTSAARGGLIEPFSLEDPSYPAALRNAVRGLSVGEATPAVAIEGGYVLARLEEIIPEQPSAPRGGTASEIEEIARAEQERVLMSALARRLLAEASLTVLDPALETAWGRRADQ